MTNDEFYRGAICALAALAPFGEDTIYDDVVNTFDETELIRIARNDGAMKWSGLSKYLRRKKENEQYD
jgi:hypothetical protein